MLRGPMSYGGRGAVLGIRRRRGRFHGKNSRRRRERPPLGRGAATGRVDRQRLEFGDLGRTRCGLLVGDVGIWAINGRMRGYGGI